MNKCILILGLLGPVISPVSRYPIGARSEVVSCEVSGRLRDVKTRRRIQTNNAESGRDSRGRF